MQVIFTDCEHCGTTFSQPYDPGRRRVYCGDACKQAAYRRRKNSGSGTRRQRTGRERASSWDQEYEQARRQREREEQERKRARERKQRDREERERTRQRTSGGYTFFDWGTSQPHAGTGRTAGTWCHACGGIRGPHSVHHDNAEHHRARHRYEALHRKAASTTFTAEADACRAKAEQLKTKYGL